MKSYKSVTWDNSATYPAVLVSVKKFPDWTWPGWNMMEQEPTWPPSSFPLQISRTTSSPDRCCALHHNNVSLADCDLTLFTGQQDRIHHTNTTTILRPFFQDHPGEPVPEESFSNPPPSIPPFSGRMPFLPQPSQFILAWEYAALHTPVAWFRSAASL